MPYDGGLREDLYNDICIMNSYLGRTDILFKGPSRQSHTRYSIRQYRNRIEIININTTDKRWNGGVMSIFTGAGVAIVTPMKANGEINYDKLAELLDYQINNSTDAIVICGTTGESATMTEKEHIEAIRFTADYVKKRVPVVAGTGSNCTKTAVELSKEAQAAGVDGCLVVTPYYNKATQKGLIEHYTAVARSIDLPIIMYNVPSRTGCNIQPETAVKLAREVDNIVAIKAATGNLSQESKTMMLAEANFCAMRLSKDLQGCK